MNGKRNRKKNKSCRNARENRAGWVECAQCKKSVIYARFEHQSDGRTIYSDPDLMPLAFQSPTGLVCALCFEKSLLREIAPNLFPVFFEDGKEPLLDREWEESRVEFNAQTLDDETKLDGRYSKLLDETIDRVLGEVEAEAEAEEDDELPDGQWRIS